MRPPGEHERHEQEKPDGAPPQPRSVASSEIETRQTDGIRALEVDPRRAKERQPGQTEGDEGASKVSESPRSKAVVFWWIEEALFEGLGRRGERLETNQRDVAMGTALRLVRRVKLSTKGARQERHPSILTQLGLLCCKACDRKHLPGGPSSAFLASVDVSELFGLDPASPRLTEALTHPSYAHEFRGAIDNQRLEFLGDAVLDFVASQQLFTQYPEADEGELTRKRAQLVSTEALALFARHHGIGQALRFGRGAGQSSLDDSDNVLADAVEALLAATYLDSGWAAALQAGGRIVEFGLSRISTPSSADPKSELQKQVQAQGQKAPTYELLRQSGPAHEMLFEVSVRVGGRELGRGTGRSKKIAERAAASAALLTVEALPTDASPAEEDS